MRDVDAIIGLLLISSYLLRDRLRKGLKQTFFKTANFDPLRSCISLRELNLQNRSDGATCFNISFRLVPYMTL